MFEHVEDGLTQTAVGRDRMLVQLLLEPGVEFFHQRAAGVLMKTQSFICGHVLLFGNPIVFIYLCQGGKFGGWALYMDNGNPAYTYNYFGLESYTVKSPTAIDKDAAEVKLDFKYDGGDDLGKGGIATLYVDGKKVAEGRIEKTEPSVFSADETADVGKDDATQVADKVFKNVEDSEFTGYVKKVVISIPEK